MANNNDELIFKDNSEFIDKVMKPQEDKFFKKQTTFTKIKNYFKRQEIQTADSLDSNLKVATKDSLWYYSQLGWAWAWYEKNIAKLSIDRRRRYEEYNLMDQDAMISGSLDVYADECCSMSIEEGTTINVESENDKVTEEVEDLFFETLQLEDQVWGLSRDLIKFGDSPFEIVMNEAEDGLAKLIPIPLDGFYRIEEDRTLKRFEFRLQESLTDATANLDAQGVPQTIQKIEYEPYQVCHFTLKTNDPRLSPYGLSILEGARKTWKQLKIMEESLIINRLTRAPERRVFYIDVGNMGPAEVKTFINQIKQDYAKRQFYNPVSGEIDQMASPLAQQEDFYIPTRESTTGQRGTRIETLPGWTTGLDQIADINFFRDKIMAALKIPPAYLGRLTGTPDGSTNVDMTKSGLSVLDKRFGRTIMRIQKAIVSQLFKLAYIQLFLKGYSAEDIKSLKITMTIPSNIDELTKLELINARLNALNVAKSINSIDGQQLLSDQYVLKNILRMEDEEIEEMKKQRMQEMPAAGPAEPGGGGGGGGGATGGIEGEFSEFAKGKEGEEPKPGEEIPPEEGEVPPEEEGGEVPGEEVAERPEEMEESKLPHKHITKYITNRHNHFDYLLYEGQFKGLIENGGKKESKLIT